MAENLDGYDLDSSEHFFGPISEEDIKKCVTRGLIPKRIANALFKEPEQLLSCEWLQLNKQLPEDLRDAIKSRVQVLQECAEFFTSNRDKILCCLNEKENSIFRVSRDITDSKFPAHDSKLVSDVTDSKVWFPYLNLTDAEDKAVLILCQLLAEKSERFNQSSSIYYMGNAGKGKIIIKDVEMETAWLTITPHEFYRTYLGRSDYGSDNTKHLWETIISLSKKQFLVTISYKDNKKFSTIRQFSHLFNLRILNQDLSEEQVVELCDTHKVLEGRGCLLKFKFNPIFTNAIREKYTEYPENIHLRIAQTPSAGKNGKVPHSTHLMRDLLFREKQLKRYNIERNENTLIRDLSLEKEHKAGRRKRVQSRITQALKIFNELGLIEYWEKTTGAKGQVKYVILINKNFN